MAPRGLPELKKRIEQIEASIVEFLSKAENSDSLEESYSANQQADRLTKELTIPNGTYFDRLKFLGRSGAPIGPVQNPKF